jgi:hypothetical protein
MKGVHVSVHLCFLVSRRRCQSKEYEHGLIEAEDILVIEAPDMSADFGFRDGGHLVHHQAAWGAQSIAFVRFDRMSEQRCVRVVGRERADRDGFGSVEAVILKDDDGPRLAGVTLAARNGPDLAASHSCPSASSKDVDIASMNA